MNPPFRHCLILVSLLFCLSVGVSHSLAQSPPMVSISGALTLEDLIYEAAPQEITFTLRPTDNSGDITRTLSVWPNGLFMLTDVPRKNYVLHIKGAKYLAKNVTVNASEGNVSNVAAFFAAADANGDNSVDVFDLDALIRAFDSTPTDSNWNPNADFNGDGSVDVFDLDLLIRNFDMSGDS